MQEQELVTQIHDDFSGIVWQLMLFSIRAVLGKLERVVNALRQDDTKLSQLCP